MTSAAAATAVVTAVTTSASTPLFELQIDEQERLPLILPVRLRLLQAFEQLLLRSIAGDDKELRGMFFGEQNDIVRLAVTPGKRVLLQFLNSNLVVQSTIALDYNRRSSDDQPRLQTRDATPLIAVVDSDLRPLIITNARFIADQLVVRLIRTIGVLSQAVPKEDEESLKRLLHCIELLSVLDASPYDPYE